MKCPAGTLRKSIFFAHIRAFPLILAIPAVRLAHQVAAGSSKTLRQARNESGTNMERPVGTEFFFVPFRPIPDIPGLIREGTPTPLRSLHEAGLSGLQDAPALRFRESGVG